MTGPAAPLAELSSASQAHDVLARSLSTALERLRGIMGAPGASGAVMIGGGALVSAAVGSANVHTGAPLGVHHRLLGGSTGKSLLAATALKLALDGAVDLDALLMDQLGAQTWYRALPNARDLTLRLLLRQAGGLPDHMGLPGIMPLLVEKTRRDGPDAFLSPLEAVALVANAAPVHPAGEGFFYSDTSFVVAGLALEHATGRDLFDLTDDAVRRPLGLTQTTPARARRIADLAAPHLSQDGALHPALDQDGDLLGSPATEWAGGGYVTTPADLVRFMAAYASGAAFVPAYLDQVLDLNRFSWSPGHVGAYGLGVFVSETSLGPAVGHGGYFPGFQSNVVHFPKQALTVAYQVNVSAPFGGYADVVSTRTEAVAQRPAADAPLTVSDDATVTLAKAVLAH